MKRKLVFLICSVMICSAAIGCGSDKAATDNGVTSVVEESTDKAEESTDKVEESTEKTEESTDKVEESTEKTEESTEKTEESTDKAEESTDKAEESTETTEEITDKVEEITDKAEESTDKVEESTETTEESTETTEETTEGSKKISPRPSTVDVNNLDSCTVAVSLQQGGAYVDDTGVMKMDVTVYTYDLYDMTDMSSLKEGDVIVIGGQEVIVTSLEQNTRGLLINGGLDENGYEFETDDSTVWYESGYNDAKSYYEVGKATIRVSEDMNFYDNANPDKGEIVYYPGDFLIENSDIEYHFVPENTSIVIDNGMIIEMHREYMP